MVLGERLSALYQMVPRGSVVADIGCDHGLLAMELVKNNICDHVYACDLRKKPLARAQEAIKHAALQDRITCLLQDGISDLAEDVDTVVIAGMGYDTIKHILESNPQELRIPRRFIIQSNTHTERLREWISAHRYTILAEDLVEEDEHFYEIVCFHCEPHEPYDSKQHRYGVYLPEKPLFLKYMLFRFNQVYQILSQMPENHPKYDYYKQCAQEISAQFMHQLQKDAD